MIRLTQNFRLQIKSMEPNNADASISNSDTFSVLKHCVLFQVNPVIQAVIMVVLAMYAAIHYSRGCGGSRISGKAIGGLMLSGLIFFYGVLAVPPGYLASIVNVEDKRYCEIVTSGNHQRDISIFYLTYSAILSYWLPLMVSSVSGLISFFRKFIYLFTKVY